MINKILDIFEKCGHHRISDDIIVDKGCLLSVAEEAGKEPIEIYNAFRIDEKVSIGDGSKIKVAKDGNDKWLKVSGLIHENTKVLEYKRVKAVVYMEDDVAYIGLVVAEKKGRLRDFIAHLLTYLYDHNYRDILYMHLEGHNRLLPVTKEYSLQDLGKIYKYKE